MLAPLRILLPPVFNVDIPLQMTPVLQTLQHFDTVTYCSLGSEPAQVIIRSCMHTMIIENACLMHAVNGTSAAHLSYLVPAAQNAQQHRQSKLAAAYHWQKALQLFQDELSLGVNEKNMDALLSTMMLVCVYQFMLNESLPNPSESFVYAPAEKRQNCLQWLHIQHGFQALVTELGDRLRLSMWNPVLEDGEVKQTTRQFLVPPAGDEVHALFLDLCEISEKSSSEQNPFYTPLEHLLFFRRPEASVNKFTKLISFVGTVDERFHRLLLIREKRALLILAYWLAMMSELEQWWISRRARNECTAITAFLMSDPDEKVRKLLAYPARIMGMMDVSMKASLV